MVLTTNGQPGQQMKYTGLRKLGALLLLPVCMFAFDRAFFWTINVVIGGGYGWFLVGIPAVLVWLQFLLPWLLLRTRAQAVLLAVLGTLFRGVLVWLVVDSFEANKWALLAEGVAALLFIYSAVHHYRKGAV